MSYCKKHDRLYEDTSPCKLLPFYECVECREEEAQEAEKFDARAGTRAPETKWVETEQVYKP